MSGDISGESGRYNQLGWLDSGAYGDVWKIQDKHTNTIYAAKEISFRGSIEEEECIFREKNALVCLKHECIIRLVDMVIFPSKVWLIEEFADLGSLQDATALHESLGDNDHVCLVRQLIQALLHCHRQNIAHMDINPRNILLTSPLSLKLADFGQALFSVDAVLTGQDYLGDRKYLPPEILSSTKFLPKAVDIWGVGCAIYYILTRNHLFSGSTEMIRTQQMSFCQDSDMLLTSRTRIRKSAQLMLHNVLVHKPRFRPQAKHLDKLAHHVGFYGS